MVANWAPTRLWMCRDAHAPKAAEPPTLFIRATIIPRMTRKIRMPTLPEPDSLETIPPSSLKSRVLIVSSRLPFAYSRAPVTIPTNKEE